MGFRPGWLRHWGIDPLYNALLQAPLAAGGRQWVLAFRLSPFAFRLSPFAILPAAVEQHGVQQFSRYGAGLRQINNTGDVKV